MSQLPVYTLTRTFNAPRELVWRTWTEADLLARWYGPNVETIIHKLDVEVGGLWLNEMRWGEKSHYQRVEYLEVESPKRLVWLHSNADESWNVISNPMMQNWPLVLLTTVNFEAVGQQTNMQLTWVPHNASEAEVQCFAAAIAGLDKGWGAGMELLQALLAELQE